MAVALKALFDKKRVALARARFGAWWEGQSFNEEAALAAFEAAQAKAAANDPGGADDALFDEPPFDWPARLRALMLIWGEGRVRPGDDAADKLEPARLGIAPDGVLAFLSPGLVGPVIAVAGAHPGKIDAFEWREETIEALRYGVRQAKLEDRVSVTRIDLEAHVWPTQHYDGLLSIDDLAYVGFPPHLAHQMIKCLKPGACAVLEAYTGLRIPELSTAFATSFAEPQIRAHGDQLQTLRDVGFSVEGDEDLTDEFLALARHGFKRLAEGLAKTEQLDVAAARELAWEAEAWRMRTRLLTQRRLERRRFILRRPADEAPAQAENTNTPEG